MNWPAKVLCWLFPFFSLVGNKNDDPERKVVETEDAYKFAGQMEIQLFETSAKENINVEEVISYAEQSMGNNYLEMLAWEKELHYFCWGGKIKCFTQIACE